MLIEIGGGRHNEFVNNTILGGTGSIHLDSRGGGGCSCCKNSSLPYAFLWRVPYSSKAWSKYPGLSRILSDDPCSPRHNVIAGNILCGGMTTLPGLTPAQAAKYGSVMRDNRQGTAEECRN